MTAATQNIRIFYKRVGAGFLLTVRPFWLPPGRPPGEVEGFVAQLGGSVERSETPAGIEFTVSGIAS